MAKKTEMTSKRLSRHREIKEKIQKREFIKGKRWNKCERGKRNGGELIFETWASIFLSTAPESTTKLKRSESMPCEPYVAK